MTDFLKNDFRRGLRRGGGTWDGDLIPASLQDAFSGNLNRWLSPSANFFPTLLVGLRAIELRGQLRSQMEFGNEGIKRYYPHPILRSADYFSNLDRARSPLDNQKMDIRSGLAFMAVANILSASICRSEDWTTRGGTTYHHVTVIGGGLGYVNIVCDEGRPSLQLEDLPSAVKKSFGYVPDESQEDTGGISDQPHPAFSVYVYGPVKRQGEVKILANEKLTCTQAVARAGGLVGDFAAIDHRYRLQHKNPDGTVVTTFHWMKGWHSGEKSVYPNPVVQAGDTIIISYSVIIN